MVLIRVLQLVGLDSPGEQHIAQGRDRNGPSECVIHMISCNRRRSVARVGAEFGASERGPIRESFSPNRCISGDCFCLHELQHFRARERPFSLALLNEVPVVVARDSWVKIVQRYPRLWSKRSHTARLVVMDSAEHRGCFANEADSSCHRGRGRKAVTIKAASAGLREPLQKERAPFGALRPSHLASHQATARFQKSLACRYPSSLPWEGSHEVSMLVHFWADDLATHLRTALVGKRSADHCEYSTKLPDSAAPDDALNDRAMRALVLRLSLQHKAGSHITAPLGRSSMG